MRIKVTGYLHTEDLRPEHVDTTHEMGLSALGYDNFVLTLPLEDAEFVLETD